MQIKVASHMIKIVLALVIATFLGLSASSTCQAYLGCDERGMVNIRVPNSYPSDFCGQICGTPEEKVWWESRNSTLPLRAYLGDALIFYIALYLIEYAGKMLYRRLRTQTSRREES